MRLSLSIPASSRAPWHRSGRVLAFIAVALIAGAHPTAAWGVDTDGDGVDDSVDNCPTIPNPPPLFAFDPGKSYTGGQQDDDCDGIGNACDTAFAPAGGFHTAIDPDDLAKMQAAWGKKVKDSNCPLDEWQHSSTECELYDIDGRRGFFSRRIRGGDFQAFRLTLNLPIATLQAGASSGMQPITGACVLGEPPSGNDLWPFLTALPVTVVVKGYGFGNVVHLTVQSVNALPGLNLAFANAVSFNAPAASIPGGPGNLVSPEFGGFIAALPTPPGPISAYVTDLDPIVDAVGTTALGANTLVVSPYVGTAANEMGPANVETYIGAITLTGDVVANPLLWRVDAVCDLGGPCSFTGAGEVAFELRDPNGALIAIPAPVSGPVGTTIIIMVLMLALVAALAMESRRRRIA